MIGIGRVATAVSLIMGALFTTATVAAGLETRDPEVCGYPTTPLYMVIHTSVVDRFYTTDPIEVENALNSGSWFASSVVGYVYDNSTGHNIPGAIPFYGLYDSAKTDHYLTTSWDVVQTAITENGAAFQGIIGYVHDETFDCSGSAPLYGLYHAEYTVHEYTTSAAHVTDEVTNWGWTDEGVVAYIFAP